MSVKVEPAIARFAEAAAAGDFIDGTTTRRQFGSDMFTWAEKVWADHTLCVLEATAVTDDGVSRVALRCNIHGLIVGPEIPNLA